MSFTNLELRASSSIASIGGLYFSTFFGGSDTSWATPTSQYTYFKNIALYAGTGAANGTGTSISTSGGTGGTSAAFRQHQVSSSAVLGVGVVGVLVTVVLGLVGV